MTGRFYFSCVMETPQQKSPCNAVFYTVVPTLLLLYIFLTLFVSYSRGDEEHWQNYLDHKYNYISHFSEMVRRKSDLYNSKRNEYSSWLTRYRETEREDQRTRSESDDEQLEDKHEHSEVSREQEHDGYHHSDRMYKRAFIKKKDLKDIVQNPKEALQFFKRRS